MNKIQRLRIKQAKLTKQANAAAEVKARQTNGHQPEATLLNLNQPNEEATVDPPPGYQVVKASVSFLTADPDPVLNTRTSNIVYALEDNEPYVTLAGDLPPITAANGIFADAMAAAADGGKTLKAAKNAARGALVSLLRPLAGKVQLLCQDNMTILLSSGFPVQKPNRTPAQVPATPITPFPTQGLTGQVYLVTGPVAGAYIYNWRLALADAPDVVVVHAQSTGSRIILNGLIPGKTYLFQVNAVGTAGTSGWSMAATMMMV